MKVTRYAQSCLLIESANSRVLIDPGEDPRVISKPDELGKLDAILITHEHADHFDAQLCIKFLEQGIPVYANASTARLIKGKAKVVENAQEFQIGDLLIKTIELPHCLMPDGSEGPQNVGYLINNKFFHPGDGKEIKGLQVDNLALPIIGPDISIKDALSFAKEVSAKEVIAIHYDRLGLKPEMVAFFAEAFKMPFKLNILAEGKSVEL